MVTLSQIREASRHDTWPRIEWLLKRGGRPKLENILKALSGEEAIPALTRAHIAALLSGAMKSRGRKDVPDGEDPEFHKMLEPQRRAERRLMLLIEIQRDASELKGPDPLEAAIKNVATRRNIAVGTVRRYYLAACKEWPEAANGPHEI